MSARLQVATVILNGTVSRDIRSAERIELASRANVDGDVYYHLIEMAMGAQVNGSLVQREETSSPVISFGRDMAGGQVSRE
ncbi:MAG: polymer-forming cytoskeletal protein [Gammaproteobacteria bacterium]